jgi:NADPH:quinone reductase-like Zn-dependent oxidoreductase
MQAFRPDGAGRVVLDNVDEPEPGPDEALVAVSAFSVNRGETLLLERPRPGWRPGKDVAGRVVRAAADGSGPPAGARVVGHPSFGGWAQRVAVPTTALATLPEHLPATTAAALPLAGLTAIRLLRAAGSLLGRRLLITGASGGVGHYVTELAVTSGAEVTAVAASVERGARLAELGATVVSDPADAPGRYDVALESVGGTWLAAARRKTRPEGVVIWFGQASREPATLDFFDWVDGTAGAPIIGFDYTRSARPDADDLATLVRLAAGGRLHPELGVVRPWLDTPDVITDLRARRIRGNAVLTVTDEPEEE